MDVGELKRLCSTNSNGTTYSPGPGTPGSSLHSPLSDGRHVQGRGIHAARVLIADDCALMERLIWFAQAHDLLKKNAERAPKPAQDSNAALETNQRQVQTLEEQLAGSDSLHVLSLHFFLLTAWIVDTFLVSLLRISLWSRSARLSKQRRSVTHRSKRDDVLACAAACRGRSCSARGTAYGRRSRLYRSASRLSEPLTATRTTRDQPRANRKRDSATATVQAWEAIAI
jgi:hypothetical protein